MVLPLLALLPTLISGASAAAGYVANNNAVKAANRSAARGAAQSGAAFDERMGNVNASDARIADLLDRQYAEQTGLQSSTFDTNIDQSRLGFDEQYGVANKAFDDQMNAFGGLMTAAREARLGKQAASEAERARQRALQDQADTLGAALPGQVGFEAQKAGKQAALDLRSEFIRKNMAPTSAAPALARDASVAGLFAGQRQRGVGEALTDSTRDANMRSYGDAYQGSERNLATFADAVNQLTNKAQLSRSALPAEIAQYDTKKGAAQADYDWTSAFIGDQASRESGILGDYRANTTKAGNDFADKMGATLDNYYGDTLGSENTYINRLMDTSTALENKLTNLNNYKIANTKPNTGLADLLALAGQGVSAYAKGQAIKNATKAA